MTAIKSLAMYFPESVQNCLRRAHYRRKLSGASLEDEPDLRVVAKLVGEGDTVLDIGANYGLYSRFLSEAVGPAGRVFSFEPIPAIYGALAHNIAQLGLTNVRSFNTGLSDHCGTQTIHVPKWPDGTSNYYEASLDAVDPNGCSAIEVELATLDGLGETLDLRRLDFIKCDVEGHEIPVLIGAATTIRKFKPAILLEVNSCLTRSEEGRKVRDLIESFDYTINLLSDGEIVPWSEGARAVNYVLLPRGFESGQRR